MICKQFLALFLWCHCYQILLNPLLQLLALGLTNLNGPPLSSFGFSEDSTHLGYYVSGSAITASASKVTLPSPGQEIKLLCTIAGYPEAKFTWYKKRIHPLKANLDDARVELTSADPRYIITNNELIIKSSMTADVGDYWCHVRDQLDGIDQSESSIQVRPKPYIYEFPVPQATYKSVVVEEGASLKIPCNVSDDFFPPESITISWHMHTYEEDTDINDIHSGEDGIELITNNRTSVDLIIGKVTKDHRRYYKCQVSNGVTENSKTILIRVKNKYTVIWPAVGIVLELVILIGVIIVVENRRVEPDKGAYDRKAIHQM